VNADPKNAEMIMELSYSLINLGGLEAGRQKPDTDKTLELMQSAVQYNQMALVLDPENAVYRQELVNARAFLADAWLEVCNPGKAYELKHQNVELARQFAAEAPDRRERQIDLAYALSGLAAVQKQLSLTEPALHGLRESESLLSEVLKLDPDNRSIAWEINLRKHRVLSIEAYSGEARKSWEEYKMLLPGFEADFNQSMKSDFGAAVDLAEMEIDFSALAYRQGDQQGAREELGKALQRLVQLIREKPDNRASRYQVARAAFEQWAQTGQLPQADIDAALGDYLRDPASVKSCSDIGLAAKLAVMHGDEMLARRYTFQLREKGFFDPQFMSFCRGYGICD
jgi:tetratricopeptide (TPR) repeat protein